MHRYALLFLCLQDMAFAFLLRHCSGSVEKGNLCVRRGFQTILPGVRPSSREIDSPFSSTVFGCGGDSSQKRKHVVRPTSCNMSSSSQSPSSTVVVPRAAVSVVARWAGESVQRQQQEPPPPPPRYLLVQRGKEPNKGMWSFPGGKIETGEGHTRCGEKRTPRKKPNSMGLA